MKKLLLTLTLGATVTTGMAVTPLWMRDVKISPDGSQIAFCYKGDIYKVASTGGSAVRLTSHDSYESVPVWSPDGKQIAFASDRYGNNDVFIMNADGGSAVRLTTKSGGEVPEAFSPDGKYVYFSANNQKPAASALFPDVLLELYKVPATGGRQEQALPTPAECLSFAKDGSMFVYQDRKGYEDVWRKHHTSSVTRDIWAYDTKTGKHTNLTAHAGEDLCPALSADGSTVYFLSERNGGSMNVYSMPLANPAALTKISDFITHPVRFLSVADNGTMCYTYDGAIYTQLNGEKPALVDIDIVRDDVDLPSSLSFTNGATSASVSPDGKQVAFTVRGNVFVTSVEYGTTKQITNTVEGEADVDFGADNRSLVYASERNGHWGLYTARIKRSDDLNFPNATLIDEQPLLADSLADRQNPKFSPDGKEVAFIEDECRLMVVNVATKAVRQVTDGSEWFMGGFNYAWSPDGKWFSLEIIGNGHDPYSDVAIVKADGSEKPVNLTGSGYFSSQPRWVLDGNAVLFLTDRYGMRSHASWGSLNDVMLVFMNKDAYDKFRLSKEDYELQKELEKEQKKNAEKADADKKKGKKKKPKAIQIILAIVLALAVGITALAMPILNKITYDEKKVNEYVNADDLKSSSSVTNILLLGVDARADEESNTSRSDSMMVVSLDSKNHCIKLVSFLRDTWVYIPCADKNQRLNAACSLGGYQGVADTIEYNFGIKIDGYVVTDFEMFKVMVDSIGGVEVDVTEKEANEVTNHQKRYDHVTLEAHADR